MGVIYKRPDPALMEPYVGVEPLDPHWRNVITRTFPSDSLWPLRFTDWNGPLADLPERVLSGLRSASRRHSGNENNLSLLSGAAVHRALAVTREEYFEPTPDLDGAVTLVRHICETETPIDAKLVHTLGLMLAQPALEPARRPGSFRTQECFVTNPSGMYRACCPPADVESAVEEVARGVNTARGLAPMGLAAWVYAQMCIIHPFTNGNGRVARVLASIVLLKRGRPPLTYVPYDNVLLYSVFQQVFAKGAAMRALTFTRAFEDIHARTLGILVGEDVGDVPGGESDAAGRR